MAPQERQLAEPAVFPARPPTHRKLIVDAEVMAPVQRQCRCGEELLDPRWNECGSCYRDAKGEFSFGDDE